MHSACFAVACIAVDINEDGDVNVADIGYIKTNLGKVSRAAVY